MKPNRTYKNVSYSFLRNEIISMIKENKSAIQESKIKEKYGVTKYHIDFALKDSWSIPFFEGFGEIGILDTWEGWRK